LVHVTEMVWVPSVVGNGSVATPPTVTITSPPAGAMYWLPSDVPAIAFTCTPNNGTVAATVVVADGATLAATDPLPSTPGTHSLTVTCTDSSGLSATATTSYSVADPLRAPDRTLTTPEEVAGQLDLVTPIVAPPGVTITVESVGSPAHGAVSAGSAGVTYTPAQNYVGSDSFTYTVVGSNGQRATATVSVTVTPVNDAPVAVDDALAVDARASVEIDFARLVANDTDIDGGALSVTSITPAGGTVTGRLTSCTGTRPACQLYVAPQSAGTESFDYVVSDGNGGTDTGRLTITVRPIALPDYLYVSMPCDNIDVSGATTGIRITRQFGVILVRGLAQLGSQSAWFNVIGFERGGFAYGWVFFGNGNNSRTLVPQSITNPIGDTWVITGYYRIGRQVCPFQINVRDGG
jgi:Bacterial Ig domain